MYVNIIFDASYCPINKFGTYCFYVMAGKSYRFGSSGILKECKSPSEAEMMALGNALYKVRKTELKGQVSHFTIHSDCMSIFGKINEKSDHELGVKILGYMVDCLKKDEKGNIKKSGYYLMKHVKAHTGKSDYISRINEYCHNQAKIQLQLRREQINEENNIFGEKDEARRELPEQLPVDSRKQSNQSRKLHVSMRNQV